MTKVKRREMWKARHGFHVALTQYSIERYQLKINTLYKYDGTEHRPLLT
jgi:hypothetical protein